MLRLNNSFQNQQASFLPLNLLSRVCTSVQNPFTSYLRGGKGQGLFINLYELNKSSTVIPTQAGVQRVHWLDSRLRGNDECTHRAGAEFFSCRCVGL
jgi:hypothetical protein